MAETQVPKLLNDFPILDNAVFVVLGDEFKIPLFVS